MKASCFFRLATVLGTAAVAAVTTFASAQAADATPAATPAPAAAATAPAARCSAPADLVRLVHPLSHMAHKLAAGQPVKIVAIGSSSTAGAGASSPAMSYPSRLQVELQALFPRAQITVVNQGANGEESRDMLARFREDVFAQQPDVVLWQVGSNSVLRDRPLVEANAPVHDGLKMLHDAGVDVVLIDPQFAPNVTKHDVKGMVDLIHVTAKEANVDLFERYAIMQHWQTAEGLPFSTFVSPDGIHMNDWGYGCWAKLFAGSLHEAATRATVTATAVTAAKH